MFRPKWITMFVLMAFVAGSGASVMAKPAKQPEGNGFVQKHMIYQDMFFGPRFTKSGDVDTSVGNFSSVGWKMGITTGFRFGYWFNKYIGGALDVFSYDSVAKDQNIDFTASNGARFTNVPINDTSAKVETHAIGFDILGSYPLGRIFVPYAGIAPTIFMNHVTLLSSGVDGSGLNFGFQIPIGMKYMLLQRDRIALGLLSEVRFTYNPVGADIAGGDVKTKIFSTHLIFGLTLNYDL